MMSTLPLLLAALVALAPRTDDGRIGEKVANFSLTTAQGSDLALYDDAAAHAATVLVWTSVECPIARLYAPRLARLEQEYRDFGVRFLGVDPNIQDSAEEVRTNASEVGIGFPILLDPMQAITDRLGVTRTTEVILLDRESRIRYRGALDDQYSVGAQKPAAREHYLLDALEEVLAGEEVTRPRTDAPGCLVGRVLDGDQVELTYHRDIAPILEKQCVDCHRPGQIGPMALQDYEEVRGWAPMMAEVVENGRMPPWHADPAYGQFENRRLLTATEKAALIHWARHGAPEGDAADHPAPRVFEDEGWAIGAPDFVAQLDEPQEIPAEGVVPYRYVMLDPGLTEDHWVQAMEIRPTNTSVTHHVLVLLVPPGRSEREALRGLRNGDIVEDGYFAVNVPGCRPNVYPAGMGKFLPAGSKLMFQLHYTPTGRKGTDQTRIGFRWADGVPEKEVLTRGVYNPRIDIPPGEAEATFHARHTFQQPVRLISLFPHLHTRGKSFRFELIGDEDEVILDIPAYDFNWQNFYRFREPYFVDEGEILYLTATYDNSSGNPFNPDPDARVRWGDQTFEEMFIGYVDYVLADAADTGEPGED